MTDKPQPDDPIRAFREPFVLPSNWDPMYGHCSRCKRLAILHEDRWHHDGAGCDPRKAAPAHFVLGDPPGEEDRDA